MSTIPENIIVLWPGAHGDIPTGWARDTNYDGRFPKGTTGSPAPGNNDGSTSHTHTAPSHSHSLASHTHSSTAPETAWYGGQTGHPRNQERAGVQGHEHTFTTGSVSGGTSASTTPTFSTTTISPSYSEMIAIKSDGTPTGFPDDSVVYYNSGSAPTGWTNHADSRERFVKVPAACGNGGTESGGGSHTHSGTAHTHNAPSSHDHGNTSVSGDYTNSQLTGTGCCGVTLPACHAHTFDVSAGAGGSAGSTSSASTAAQTYTPPYHVLLGIQNTSGADDWLEEAIVMWGGSIGSIPDDWTLCDGGDNESGNATPNLNGKYVLMAASGGGDVGNTGGSAGHDHTDPASHTHTQSHTHSVPESTATGALYGIGTQVTGPEARHPHPSHTTGSNTTAYSGTVQTVDSTANTEPLHRTVAYLSAPEKPTAGSVAMFGANF